jgi:hypothetical protein
MGITQGTGLVSAASVIYVMDNGVNANGTHGQLLAFTPGANGALQAEPNGVVPIDPTQTNPVYLISESGGKWLYVANQGDNSNTTNPQSGITAFTVVASPFTLTPIANGGGKSGVGAGPQCLLEDPSKQYVYSANFNDSSVTGLYIDHNSGDLAPLSQKTKAKDTYLLPGPPAWCVVSGR